MIRSLGVFALTIVLLWTTAFTDTGARAQSSESAADNEAALTQLDGLFDALEALRAQIDRSQFDLDELTERLGPDVDRIVEFTRREIGYEPYAGTLRGAEGTLTARAGNPLDQSLLLATLLKSIGLDARIHRGRLSPEQARSLLATVEPPTPYPSPLLDTPQAREAVQRLASVAGVADLDLVDVWAPGPPGGSTTSAGISTQAEELVTALTSQLSESGVELGDPAARSDLVEEARDYYWVEYRSDERDWEPVHPSVPPDADIALNVEPTETFEDTIPSELQHLLKFEAVLTQRLGDSYETHALMAPWERPVANLNLHTLDYTVLPNGFGALEEWSPQAAEAALDETNLFFPQFNNDFPEGGQAFDLNGNVVPPEEGASMMAALFQTVGDKIGGAASALGGLGAEPGAAETDAWGIADHAIEITLTAPGGETTQIKRSLASNLDGSDLDRDALGTYAAMTVITGRVAPALVLDRYLEAVLGTRRTLEVLLGRDTGPLSGDEPSQVPPLSTYLLSQAVDRGAGSFSGADASFLVGPYVVGEYRHAWLFDRPMGGIDIANSSRRHLSVMDGETTPQPEAALRFGVWESVAEARAAAAPEGPAFNAADALGDELQIIAELDDLEGFALDRHSRAALESNLRDGYHVILPSDGAEGSDTHGLSAWWRIDPGTGEALAMVSPGWGGVIPTEYLSEAVQALVKTNAVKAGAAWLKCEAVYATILKVVSGLAIAEQVGGLADILEPLSPTLALVVRALGLGAFTLPLLINNKIAFMQRCIPAVWKVL